MTDKINIAFLGSGIFVREQHLQAVQKSPHLVLKAIYSRSLKSAQTVSEGLSGIDLYSEDSDKSLKDLLARSDIQAVIIALPIAVQPSFIKQALSAGKHVLAEKPLAPDVASARELLAWTREHTDPSKVTYAVAEQFRFLTDVVRGAEVARTLGRVVGFRLQLTTIVPLDSKYVATEWRKKPTFQGGFLLDGGVHFVAAMRLLLGNDARVERVSAYTTQLQPYLQPIDTVDASLRLAGGATGSFLLSFGSNWAGQQYMVACERGNVTVTRDKVTIRETGGEEVTETTPSDIGGVELEVAAWAKGLVEGKPDPRQSAEEALADLEILEAMIVSGADGGKPVELKHQV